MGTVLLACSTGLCHRDGSFGLCHRDGSARIQSFRIGTLLFILYKHHEFPNPPNPADIVIFLQILSLGLITLQISLPICYTATTLYLSDRKQQIYANIYSKGIKL